MSEYVRTFVHWVRSVAKSEWGATHVSDRRELLPTGAVKITFTVVLSREDCQDATTVIKPAMQLKDWLRLRNDG